MMSENFTVEIITPERSIIKTEANEVTLPSYEGEMGILKDHISLITFLRPGLVQIFNKNQETFFVEEGTVEFSNNNLLILTSTVKDLKSLDKKIIDDLLKDAEKKLQSSELKDKERYIIAYKIDTLKEISQ